MKKENIKYEKHKMHLPIQEENLFDNLDKIDL